MEISREGYPRILESTACRIPWNMPHTRLHLEATMTCRDKNALYHGSEQIN
jgi:hypothetical protein